MKIGYIARDGSEFACDIKDVKKYILKSTGRIIINEEGELILDINEKLISRETYNCSINTEWRSSFYNEVFRSGKGVLNLTNKRLVFLREPSWKKRFYELNPFSAHVILPEMAKQKELKKMGWKEFFEIDVSKIMGTHRPILSPLQLYFLSSGKKYHLAIITSSAKEKKFLKNLKLIMKASTE